MAGNFGGVSLVDVEKGEPVPVVTLDGLNISNLKLLKIDTEGMEADVMRGAREIVMQHRPFLYIENDRQEKSADLIELLQALGYDMWWHLPPLFNPQNYAGNPENVFGNTVSINILGVPKEMAIKLDDARKISGPDDWWQ